MVKMKVQMSVSLVIDIHEMSITGLGKPNAVSDNDRISRQTLNKHDILNHAVLMLIAVYLRENFDHFDL